MRWNYGLLVRALSDFVSSSDTSIPSPAETAGSACSLVSHTKLALSQRLSAIAAWNDILDLVNKIDWDDAKLLNLVAAGQACYHSNEDRGVPLLAMIIRLESHERESRWSWIVKHEDCEGSFKQALRVALTQSVLNYIHSRGHLICALSVLLYRVGGSFTTVATAPDPLVGQSPSIPLTQSSHSYLRDNPTFQKMARDSTGEALSEARAPPVTRVTKETFNLNNKQMKLIDRLYGVREGNVGWASVLDVSST